MNAIDLLRYFVGLEDSHAEHDHNEHREMIDQARGLIAEADAHATTLKHGRNPWGVISFEGRIIYYEAWQELPGLYPTYEARIVGQEPLLPMTDALRDAIAADITKGGCKT